MTLSLATSVGRSQDDADHKPRSNPSRVDTVKDRVAQSTHALRHGRSGTRIFVMKLGERSRAIDWYWELWRDLGGELPERMDINIPSLSTSLRMIIPKDEDMVGSKRVCKELNPTNTIQTCWDMMEKAIDIQDLLDQRSDGGVNLDLELAWKGVDGSLDWIAERTTVTGKARDWAVLATTSWTEVSKAVLSRLNALGQSAFPYVTASTRSTSASLDSSGRRKHTGGSSGCRGISDPPQRQLCAKRACLSLISGRYVAISL